MSTLRRRLKDATQPLHDEVESTALMSRLMNDDLTLAQYAGTLVRLHALYAPLEATLARVPGLADALPDLDRRFKADSLKADLDGVRERADAGVWAAIDLIDPPRIAPVTSVAQAMGTFYVLEGSTMGGRLIASKLKTKPFVDASNLSFFEHYGTAAGAYWQRFVAALETVAPDDYAVAEDAARATFRYFIALARA